MSVDFLVKANIKLKYTKPNRNYFLKGKIFEHFPLITISVSKKEVIFATSTHLLNVLNRLIWKTDYLEQNPEPTEYQAILNTVTQSTKRPTNQHILSYCNNPLLSFFPMGTTCCLAMSCNWNLNVLGVDNS